MAAFTVTNAPGFCMGGDRLFKEEVNPPLPPPRGEIQEED